MPYKIISGDEIPNFLPKVAKHSFAEKRLQESRQEIGREAEAITQDPTKFNGEKALFYFKDEPSEGLKIVPEDYASVVASSKKSARDAAPGSGQYLRPHFAAGVIVACKTSDGKIIIGSRDANRSKTDPTTYPLQFPCGFIDVDNSFYELMRGNQNPQPLMDKIISDGLRELREEVINFEDDKISAANLISAIYETKQWPQKEEKGGGTKNIHVVKSFIIAVDVNLTYAEIEAKRNQQILDLNQRLRETPEDNALKKQKKDFDEMTQMTCVEISQLPEVLAAKSNVGTDVEIEFDGKNRKFVAEHGATLNALAATLFERTTPNTSLSSTTAKAVVATESKQIE